MHGGAIACRPSGSPTPARRIRQFLTASVSPVTSGTCRNRATFERLVALVDAGTIRVIDVLNLVKDEDGSIEAMELSDIEELGELQALETELAELLAADDVVHLAAAMDSGSVAGVVTGTGPRRI